MKNTRAAIYIRVSTSEQALEGVSLTAQLARAKAYLELRGLELDAVYAENGVSAGKPLKDRPEGARLLAALRRRKDPVRHVIAVRLDRIFRSTRDCLEVVDGWNRDGVALHLLDLGGSAVDTSSSTGRFFLSVIASLAELERAKIGERTAEVLGNMRNEGRRISLRPPIGSRFKDAKDAKRGTVKMVVPDPAEQRAVRRILELRGEGVSVRKIAVQLGAEGYRARGAKGWHAKSVQRVLARAAS